MWECNLLYPDSMIGGSGIPGGVGYHDRERESEREREIKRSPDGWWSNIKRSERRSIEMKEWHSKQIKEWNGTFIFPTVFIKNFLWFIMTFGFDHRRQRRPTSRQVLKPLTFLLITFHPRVIINLTPLPSSLSKDHSSGKHLEPRIHIHPQDWHHPHV